MGKFAYVARGSAGDEQSGFVAAGTLDEAVSQLHGQGLIVLHVAEERALAAGLGWRTRLATMSIGRVGTRSLALFTRQFATVLEAGIPMVRGLRGLSVDSGSGALTRALRDIGDRIERGDPLSDSMSAHPEAFNEMYLSMIRAGERAGTLDAILDQLAVYLEKMDAIRTKVRAALSYPVFVLTFAIVAMLFLMLKVVPTFVQIYGDMGQQLPSLTLLVVNISNAIQHNALISLALLVSLVLVLALFARTGPGRYFFNDLLLHLPVFGPLVRKAVMSRFARTFGILMKSGLPILDALELVKGASGNAVVARAVEQARARIGAGHGITESFRATGKFPEMVLQLIATGEETGELDEMLLKASDFYDRQVEATVQGLTSLIEPLMIVLIGGIIGVVVVAMFLPIFHLGEAVMRGGVNL
jgi:type IV pilus assembly protein PilC